MLSQLRSFFSVKYLLLSICFSFVLYCSYLYGITYYALFFSFLIIIVCPYTKNIDKNWFLIFCFYFLYGYIPLVMYQDYTINYLVTSLIPPSFYIFGRILVKKLKYDKDKIELLLTLFILIFSVNSISMCVQEIYNTGELINYRRVMSRVVGDDDMYLPATQFGINVSLGLFGLGAFFLSKNKNIVSILQLILFLFSFLVTVHLLNRSGIVILLMVTFVMILLAFRKIRLKNLYVSILVFSIVLFIFSILGLVDTNMLSAYGARSENEARGGLFDSGTRSWRWIEAIYRIFEYPFGYRDILENDFFVHNIWLDVDAVAGFLPFVLLILITYKTTFTCWKIYNRCQDKFSIIFFAINLCFLLTFFIEPILFGSAIYFYFYCFIWGNIHEYYKNEFK